MRWLNANPLIGTPPKRTTDQCAMPHDLGRLSEDYDLSDESVHGGSSNRSKRGNAPLVNAPGSSCTCKRTKCLKLYCDCFSKNYHCGEACACEGCYNTTIYKDSVYKALGLIASREQNAFSPKARVVEGANCSTTSAVTHRRGCNCKKKFCEKKYCECYQANAACSDNCRCEGCKNTHGTRNGYVRNAETLNEMASRDTSSADGRLEGTAAINRHRSNLHLSSSGPSLQSSMF